MTKNTETTGFAMSSRQRSLTVASGAAASGRTDACATFGEFTTIAVGSADGRLGGWGNALGMPGLRESRLTVIQDLPSNTGNGSGVPADLELALERGKPLADHAEATPRRYGAPGECPRRIPA